MRQLPTGSDRAIRAGPAVGLLRLVVGVASLFIGIAVPASADVGVEELKAPGRVLMLRHANAPGTGDPAGFRIDDCATQRNLDEVGREQARRLGSRLRAQGIDRARVYSSQWCRCLETARLLGLGEVGELPALNSFWERPRDKEPNLTALRVFFEEQPREGELLVLVTHFVTIAAITGRGVGSGEGVVLALTDDGFDTLGELDASP